MEKHRVRKRTTELAGVKDRICTPKVVWVTGCVHVPK